MSGVSIERLVDADCDAIIRFQPEVSLSLRGRLVRRIAGNRSRGASCGSWGSRWRPCSFDTLGAGFRHCRGLWMASVRRPGGHMSMQADPYVCGVARTAQQHFP
jgi:hypothetical protein